MCFVFISTSGISLVSTTVVMLPFGLTYKTTAKSTKENVRYSDTQKLIKLLDGIMKAVEQSANVFGLISERFIISGQTTVNYI